MTMIDFLFIPLVLIVVLFAVVGTSLEKNKDSNLIDYFNLNFMDSKPVASVMTGVVVFILLVLGISCYYDTNEINEDLVIIQVTKGVMYYTLFSSWLWVYECYSKGFIKKWTNKLKK